MSNNIHHIASSELHFVGTDGNELKILNLSVDKDWSCIDGSVSLNIESDTGDSDHPGQRTVRLTGHRNPNLGLSNDIAFTFVILPKGHADGEDEVLGSVHLDPPIENDDNWRKNWDLILPGLLESSLIQHSHEPASISTDATTVFFEGMRVHEFLFRTLGSNSPTWERWWIDEEGRPLQVEYPVVVLEPKDPYSGAQLIRRVRVKQWID